MTLSDRDHDIISRARELADANGVDALRKVTGAGPDTDHAMVVTDALGAAQYILAELADIAERLGRQSCA